MSEVALLRQVPILADLSDELLGRLAADAGLVRLKAGDWLFREGEPAASLYVLVAGRVEVVSEGPPEVLVAEGVGLLEFHQLDVAREAGRVAAREVLEAGAHELA
jgi:CRP-like cAMP-binding protein